MIARARRLLRLVGPALAVPVLLLGASWALLAAGAACYVVTSPSMGTAAPVGSLVVTMPLGDRGAAAGDVVAFRPPAEQRTAYVHRVAWVHDGVLATQGDAAVRPDPWTLRTGDVLGRAVLVVPGAGFAVRGLPIVLIGLVVVAVVTAPLRRGAVRSALRLVGGSAVVTAAVLTVRPFIGLSVLGAAPLADGGVAVRVVSTGLLPVLVTGGGRSVALGPGETARLLIDQAGSGVDLHAGFALTWWQWLATVGACLLPAACSAVLAARDARARTAAA